MRTPTIPNLSLIPAVVAALLQAGAQLFAIAVVVGTVTKAPPRSLAMYAGEYGYNSGPFWEMMPTVPNPPLHAEDGAGARDLPQTATSTYHGGDHELVADNLMQDFVAAQH